MSPKLASAPEVVRLHKVPRPEQTHLTDSQKRRLEEAERRIRDARLAWATMVKAFGFSACARDFYRTTPQSLLKKVQRVEREREA
jgi:hypothetical protein